MLINCVAYQDGRKLAAFLGEYLKKPAQCAQRRMDHRSERCAPIYHRLADRVRAHIFLCMLAYYVEWHMREAWRELMFADTDQQAPATHWMTARWRTASRPCWRNLPPSCATPAARLKLQLTHQPLTSSPTPTRSKSRRSNCSSRSRCSQKLERRFQAKRLKTKENSLFACRNFSLNPDVRQDTIAETICVPGVGRERGDPEKTGSK